MSHILSDNVKPLYQAAFDKAVELVIKQGAVCKNNDAVCLYRGPNGMKCAIGHLISDEQIAKYNIRMNHYVEYFPSTLLKEIINDDAYIVCEFLTGLQSAHDYCQIDSGDKFTEAFINRANNLAINWGLNTFKV